MQTIKYYYYWYSGLLRLFYGFCPSCNSSPPIRECAVCHGDYGYGRHSSSWSEEKKLEWKAKYHKLLIEDYLQ